MLMRASEIRCDCFAGQKDRRYDAPAPAPQHTSYRTMASKQLPMPRFAIVCLAFVAQVAALLGFAAPANAQPIDPANARGAYTGGGLTIGAADLQRLAVGLPPRAVSFDSASSIAVAAPSASTAFAPRGDASISNASSTIAPRPSVGQRGPAEIPESTGTTHTPGSSPTIPHPPPTPAPRGGSGRVLLVECDGAYGYATIQSAIEDAVDGDVVVVLPNDCTPEGRWFENINFLGKAIRVQSANPQDEAVVAATVIDGNAAGPVVIFRNDETHSSILDGLSITNGAVDQSATIYQADRGAIVVGQSYPTIRRCFVFDNDVFAIHQVGPSPDSIIVDQCRFIGNFAGIGTTPQTFVAGMIVSDCYFAENLVAITAQYAPIVLQDSIFENHDSPSLSFIVVTDARVENCTFRNNVARDAILFSSGPVLNSHFEENSARNIVLTSNYPDNEDRVVSRCYFRFNNTSSATVASTDTDVTDCVFHSNESLRTGGLSVNSVGRPTVVDRCIFIDNSGGFFSGGITHFGESIVRNSIFVGNRSESAAGAIDSLDFETHVQNSTIIGNASNGPTGGVENVVLESCVLFNNRGAGGVEDQTAQLAPGTIANYCNIQGFAGLRTVQGGAMTSIGNISDNPLFLNPGHWNDAGTAIDFADDFFIPGDYHLRFDSPCIDSGDPSYMAVSNDETDFDGEERLRSCRVDMGADEFSQVDVLLAGDFDGDGEITLSDVPSFIDVVLNGAGLGICTADINGDRHADGSDVQVLVDALLH